MSATLNRRLVLTALAIGLFLLPGCGGGTYTFNLVGSQRDPGAEGTLQVERIEGGNRLVTVSVRHLTPPERLGQNLRTYIVWFRDAQGRSSKASALEYTPDSRTGRATATTPQTRFTVVITAERNAQAAEPSDNVIFTQNVQTE